MDKLKLWLDANLKNCCQDDCNEIEININDEKEILLYILKKLESIDKKITGGVDGCYEVNNKKRCNEER